MGLGIKLAGSSLKARPGRALLSILGIAFGVAIASGVLILDYNTVEGLRKARGNDALPDLMLHAPDGQGSIDDLRAMEGVSLAIEGFQETVLFGAGDGAIQSRERPARARFLAFEADRLGDFGLITLQAGRSLQTEGAMEVLLGWRIAEELAMDPGDTLWMSRPPRLSRKVCQDGQLVAVGQPVLDAPVRFPFEVVGVLARTGLGRTANGSVLVTGHAVGQRMFEGQRVRSTFWAKQDPTADSEKLEARLASLYAMQVNRGAVLGQAADERAFRTGVRVAGLFALVLGLFVIFHTLSMSLTERVVEVGTMHALGATRGQISRVFLTEALLQALLGALLGVVLGLLLAKVLLLAGLTTLGAGKHISQFVIPWGVVWGLASAGFFVALGGSVYPLMLLGRADPGAALRGDKEVTGRSGSRGFAVFYAALMGILLPGLFFTLVPSVGGSGDSLAMVVLGAVGVLVAVLALALVAPRFIAQGAAWVVKPLILIAPFSARLARSGMVRSPGRIGASASAIALVAAGYMGLSGLTNSLRGEISVWADEAAVGKVWVKGLPDTSFDEVAAALLNDPVVLGVEMGQAHLNAPFLITGVDSNSVKGYGPLSEKPEILQLMQRGHGMILSRRLAQDGEYKIGDSIYLDKSGGEVQKFVVAEISDAYGHWSHPDERMYGIVDRSYLDKEFCIDTERVNRLAIKLDGGEDVERVRELLMGYYAGLPGGGRGVDPETWGLETGSQVLAFHRFDLERDFKLFDILVLLSAGLAALGVLNGQLLATMERAREIGIVKALGASHGQVASMVWIEALGLALVGGLLGVAVGLGIVPPVIAAVESLSGLDLPAAMNPWIPAKALLGCLAVGLIASLYPIYRLGRFDTLRAVRTG
ncbi:MAG: putative ABC transport system permease protein [Planctomycetota bacterium]|jgi:putative ABC transport system permease protein